MHLTRYILATLSDSELLSQCEVDTYRASGPGGQKRNKTSSAVRLRHLASALIVIAEESRSQHENRARALRRLRQAFYLKLREPVDGDPTTRPELAAIRTAAGRLEVGRKDARFWPAAALLLDVLEAEQGRVSEAARQLGCTTGNLIDLLTQDPKLWEHANHLRQRFGLKVLKSGD
jgi:RF-1 domain